MALKELKILDTIIKPGSYHRLNLNTANLYTSTPVEIPVIISRAKLAGPVVLITAGIHGDEINGVEIVRQIISKKFNRPQRGTIICIPLLNIFGFLNGNRMFPDGRDLNRCFPGSKNGSLASRFAYNITKELIPHVDIILDFHTGGAHRFNAPQIRIDKNEQESVVLANVFAPPFIVYSSNVSKTFRATCSKMKKNYLLFEGGKSQDTDRSVMHEGVQGILKVLEHLDMLSEKIAKPPMDRQIVHISKTRWVRASQSGLLHPKIKCGSFVVVGQLIATITDPYGSSRFKIKAPHSGYVINVNQSPLVYQGDAIFHISINAQKETETTVQEQTV